MLPLLVLPLSQRRRAKDCQAEAAADEAALQPETNPDPIFPHNIPSSQPYPQPSLQSDPSPQQQQQQQVLTRHAKDMCIAQLEAEIAQRTAQRKEHLANIAQRSADGKVAAAAKSDLEKELSEVQKALDSKTLELRALCQAVQQHLGAEAGQEREAVRRAPYKLAESRQRLHAQREAVIVARSERQCTLVPQRPLYKESHDDDSSIDSEESGDESSSDSD